MEFIGCVYCFILSVVWVPEVSTGRVPDVIITEAKSISPKKISLLWRPTSNPKRGQPEYIIRYKPKGGHYTRTVSKQTDYTIKDLVPDTTYFIAVRAVNTKSRGEWSKTAEVTTKAKSSISNDDITSNITVDEINENSVILKWTVSSLKENIKDFADFQIILKNKDKQQKKKTKGSEVRLTDLIADTSYAANLYIILNTGKKIRIGRTKFQTLELQMAAPRKLKVKAVTYKSIAVKWKHIKSPSSNDSVSGYTLQYKQRGIISTEKQRDVTSTDNQREVTNTDACTVDLDVTRKSYKIQGLLPDTKYSIRVAGNFKNFTGPFTEWLRVKTAEFSPGMEDILVYHTSPTSVMLLWKPFTEIADISNISGELLSAGEDTLYAEQNIVENKRNFEVDLGQNYIQIQDLSPQTKYRVTLTFQGQQRCNYHKIQEFVTAEVKCFEGCDVRTPNETFQYESYLRLIPLQFVNYVVTWQPYTNLQDTGEYRYVIRVLGEPFLYHLSTHLIADGVRYIVLRGLSKDKTYTVNLQVFNASHGEQPLSSQYLLVMPTKDLPLESSQEVKGQPDVTSFWQPTSIDIITSRADEEFLPTNKNESYAIQHIKEFNITLISKLYVEENWLIGNSTFMVEDVLEPPNVFKADDVTTIETMALDITCFARGDPYPMTSFLNISSNQTFNEEDLETHNTVSVTGPKYVGSSSLVDGRAFMGIRRFIRVNNTTYWDSGQYACAAENIAGSDITEFKIRIMLKPPGQVKRLFAKPLTPFEIEVGWRPPSNKTLEDPGHVIGYHVSIADEYNIVLGEKNVSDTLLILQNMEPNMLYNVKVAPYHQHSVGQLAEVYVTTPGIPTLGPPENISMVTLNSTTIQVSWLPPREVIERRIHLRAFLFHHREVGSETVEEMQLGRMFTNVSIIGLKPDRKYEVHVLAMSEDGQISNTRWVQGNTSRESYMNETVPPPPPHNVYLNLQSGNIIISWLPPFPDENILVRGYTIDVFYNNTKLSSMEVEYKESSVIIYDVEMGIRYRISVRARNRAGTSIDQWEEVKVPVEYVTQEPVQNFKGIALSSTKLELSWDPPESGVFSRFVLVYTLAGNLKPELPGGGNLPATERNYIVRSLQPFTGYVFFITPYLKDMRGVTTNTTVVTLTDKPSSPPKNISLSVLNSTTILVKSAPPDSGKNGPIIQYRVAYRESSLRDNILTEADENEDLYFHLNGLKQDTVYEIRVRALTVNGSGPWSPWLQEKTEKRVPVLPKVPQNLSTEVSGHSITLEWSQPDQHLSEITGYVVGFGRFIPEVYRTSISRDKTSHIFTSLDPETVYIVSVRSFNDFGESAAVFDLVTTE